jgi:hypothetical protein
LPYGVLDVAEVDAALERSSALTTNVELESRGLCHLSRVHKSSTSNVTYRNHCPHCDVVVKNEAVCARVDDAANGPSQLPGLGSIYFDRKARDAGAWVLISEVGEYRAVDALN